MRMRGKGIRVLNSNAYGDQYCHFEILIPKKITTRQREILQEFEEISEKENCNDCKQRSIFREALDKVRSLFGGKGSLKKARDE